MTQNGNIAHQLNYVLPHRFYVEIDGQLTASFSQCSGLGLTFKNNPYNEGGVNEQTRTYLGPVSHTDVTLTHGLTDSSQFIDWAFEALDPARAMTRRNVNILYFNPAGDTVQCWTLIGAVVTGFKGPMLIAKLPEQPQVATEQVVLSCEAIYALKSGGGGAMQVKRDGVGYFGSQYSPNGSASASAPALPLPADEQPLLETVLTAAVPEAALNLAELDTPQALALFEAALSGLPFCEVCP
ncbi:phage tail protein [Gloeobacter kilaueensis]|uniref:Phage tail protein n=1 Tax=Gloeobacter kilaueensis (strain ATCC BAA-2537 / CCAP 1431/1 / ULC 316 / JS1) TaxID=1183438 RepID=U5QLH9_GLOK1|nr:phage tail protein [Gloeobacter kilaueensis]AGY59791.1 hypothetical protein GKIL_3545 [Gloeobacter kilaueensis JS1]